MSFADGLRRQCERAKGDVATVLRKTALELQTGMVMMSPVYTGRFRGNWQVGFGTVNPDVSSPDDLSGSAAIARTAAALANWTPGTTIWLTNSLPYARRLEYGWSKQAPGGMVRLTVQNYQAALKAAIKGK